MRVTVERTKIETPKRGDAFHAMTINIAFFFHPRGGLATADFSEVARRIASRAPDIRPHALSIKDRISTGLTLLRLAARPTLTVEMERLRLGRPLRGTRFRHLGIDKIEESRRLDEAGIPVPKWTVIDAQTSLDPSEWGPYVVVKPSRGARGAFISIQRATRVRLRRPDELPADHYGRHVPMLAQQFVYTGQNPESHRVITFLGEPVLAFRYHGRTQTRPLLERYGFQSASGHNIVASALGARLELSSEEDVLALARRTHAAFPGVPSLGIDIVRDADTGKLFVLETNPSGGGWSLTQPNIRAMAREAGVDLYAQFNALDVVAQGAIDAGRRLAE